MRVKTGGATQARQGKARFSTPRSQGLMARRLAPYACPMPDAYVICATPRTGSTLLCDLLRSTGAAGSPDSFFMREVASEWRRAWGLPDKGDMSDREFDRATLRAVIEAGKGGTAIFGLRLMRESLEDVSAFLDRLFPGLPSDRARLEAAFGRTLFIHLRREDKLAQAVSLVKAGQTGLWHVAPDGRELERVAPPQEPRYDFPRIAQEIAQLERHDAAWLAWFEREGIEPLRVGYEALSAAPASVLARICDALDVPSPPPGDVRPGVARLSDAVSLDWMRRYRLDAGRP